MLRTHEVTADATTVRDLASKLVMFLETSEAPDGPFAPDVSPRPRTAGSSARTARP